MLNQKIRIKKIQLVEIGCGSGANFRYYPSTVEVTCVDPLKEWEEYLTEQLKKYRQFRCPELLVGGAENISLIRDNQIDVVVSTLTLSCCNDVNKVLKEVRRVLKPGGVFLYMENIRSENFLLAFIQMLMTPLYKLLYGISLIRNISKDVEQANFSDTTQQLFYARGIPFLMAPHVVGTARK